MSQLLRSHRDDVLKLPPALQELAARPRWVVWRYEVRDDRLTKIPYSPKTRQRASSVDPTTWSTYAEAEALASAYSGLGCVIIEPYTGVDLDNCHAPDTGALEPWAHAMVDRLHSYTEVTPSGRGVHVWVRGRLPAGRRRRGAIEMYDRDRYFTITGAHLDGTPHTIEDRQAELEALHAELFGTPADRPIAPSTPEPSRLDDETLMDAILRSRSAVRFMTLWTGEWQTLGYASQSEADLALCRMLAFWCGRDAARMDRLFRRSGLYRAKWDARRGSDTYGRRTLEQAIAGCPDIYAAGTTS